MGAFCFFPQFAHGNDVLVLGQPTAANHFADHVVLAAGGTAHVNPLDGQAPSDYSGYSAVVFVEQNPPDQEEGDRWDDEENQALVREYINNGGVILIIGHPIPIDNIASGRVSDRGEHLMADLLGFDYLIRRSWQNLGPARPTEVGAAYFDNQGWEEGAMLTNGLNRMEPHEVGGDVLLESEEFAVLGTRLQSGDGAIYWFAASPFRVERFIEGNEGDIQHLQLYMDGLQQVLANAVTTAPASDPETN